MEKDQGCFRLGRASHLGKPVVLSFCFLAGAVAARAQVSNFQIAPPPVPYPYFAAHSWDSSIEFAGGGMTWESPQASQKFNSTAGGVQLSVRHAFSRVFAWDDSEGLFISGGQQGGGAGPYSGFDFNLSNDIEIQPVGSRAFNPIIFFGPQLHVIHQNWGSSGLADDALIGPQAGLELGLRLGPVEFAPFFEFSALGGRIAQYNCNSGNCGASETDLTNWQHTVSVGGDFIVKSFSIGAFFQDASAPNNGNAGPPVKSIIGEIGFRFHHPGDKESRPQPQAQSAPSAVPPAENQHSVEPAIQAPPNSQQRGAINPAAATPPSGQPAVEPALPDSKTTPPQNAAPSPGSELPPGSGDQSGDAPLSDPPPQ